MADESVALLKVSDWVIAGATLLGPILAIQAQKWIERSREAKDRKLAIFRTLMATRAANLSPAHVEALNAVPIEFYSDKGVMDEWETYFTHLSSGVVNDVWVATRLDLFIKLLVTIGRRVGYKFNVAQMHRIYSPSAYEKIEQDNDAIRRGAAALLRGETALPLKILEVPGNPDGAALMARVAAAYVDGSMQVRIVNGP
ncbi:MAG: DUF6680 family protein [Afipia sp.]